VHKLYQYNHSQIQKDVYGGDFLIFNLTYNYQFPGMNKIIHYIYKHLQYVIILTIALLFFSIPDAFTMDRTPDNNSPWHIIADQLNYDKASGVYTAAGNVVVTRDGSKISSDFLKYNSTDSTALARGHVVVSSGGDKTTADSMAFDTKSNKGTLYNGTIFIESNHLYIKGDKIEKTGEKTYRADKVSITTCDGDSPDWKITGRDLKVTIEGYGTVFHSAFWAKKVPLLYSPFFLFPVKTKRQTGLLPPSITLNSERKGSEYFLPFFWAISDHSDATMYLRHMEKRGDLTGIEYRYEPMQGISGAAMYDYLKDHKIDDGSDYAIDNWGYEGGDIRENKKRYWFRMKHQQLLPLDITMKLNGDIVSDEDYLREFLDMKNGFEDTQAFFEDKFGSGFDTEDALQRANSLLFNKSWTTFSLDASFFWYDNIYARRNDTDDNTLQKLPEINFTASRQQLVNTPLYYDLESEYVYFYRQDASEASYKGARSDIRPGLYLPLNIRNWFTIEPSVRIRETNWYIESDFGPEATVAETTKELKGEHDRFIYETGLEISSDIYKIFNFGIGNIDKIKHSATSKLSYNYIPEREQDALPSFDSIDRIAKNNTLTFSITNYLTGRSEIKAPATDKTDITEKKYSYNQFCRFLLSQSYDINEKNESEPDNFRNQVTREREEYLPLIAELDITPVNYLSIDADCEWSKYVRGITKSSINMSLYDKRGDTLSAEYSYTRDAIESITAKIKLNITDKLYIYGSDEYDMSSEKHEHIERNAGMSYTSQCWGINLLYTDKTDERRYTLKIDLMGLGGLRSKTGAQTVEDYF